MHELDRVTSLRAAIGLFAFVVVGCAGSPPGTEPVQPTIAKVDLGDYEVVADWPRPLPDDDFSHDGWT